jgi:hypothetical protein
MFELFHQCFTKKMLHKCQWDHTTEVQLLNYKATIDYNVAQSTRPLYFNGKLFI